MNDDDGSSRSAAEAEISAALGDLVPLGPWVESAACAGLGEFYMSDWPPGGAVAAMMERTCRDCPAREACAAFASTAPVRGYWAGIWRVTEGALRARAKSAA